VTDIEFRLQWQGEWAFDREAIWPNGDAPKNPTVKDVLASMREEGSLTTLIFEWSLDETLGFVLSDVDGESVSIKDGREFARR
jgi:hypothetical protein